MNFADSGSIVVKYQNVRGDDVEEKVEGFKAMAYQHEIDHLHGIAHVDRIKSENDMSFYEGKAVKLATQNIKSLFENNE